VVDEARITLESLPAPVSVLDVDELTRDGLARRCLGVRDGETWLVRPDGHVAAVTTSAAGLAAAARRTLGLPVPALTP